MSDFLDKAKDARDGLRDNTLDKAEDVVESQAGEGGTMGSIAEKAEKAEKADDAIDQIQGSKD